MTPCIKHCVCSGNMTPDQLPEVLRLQRFITQSLTLIAILLDLLPCFFKLSGSQVRELRIFIRSLKTHAGLQTWNNSFAFAYIVTSSSIKNPAQYPQGEEH